MVLEGGSFWSSRNLRKQIQNAIPLSKQKSTYIDLDSIQSYQTLEEHSTILPFHINTQLAKQITKNPKTPSKETNQNHHKKQKEKPQTNPNYS